MWFLNNSVDLQQFGYIFLRNLDSSPLRRACRWVRRDSDSVSPALERVRTPRDAVLHRTWIRSRAIIRFRARIPASPLGPEDLRITVSSTWDSRRQACTSERQQAWTRTMGPSVTNRARQSSMRRRDPKHVRTGSDCRIPVHHGGVKPVDGISRWGCGSAHRGREERGSESADGMRCAPSGSRTLIVTRSAGKGSGGRSPR
jgi:hypothetical protein